jgi:TldD protein
MKELLQSLRDEVLRRGCQFADFRVVDRESTSIRREDGRVESVNSAAGTGLGVRVLKDDSWGFASVSSFDDSQARDCLESALAMSEAAKSRIEQPGIVAKSEPVVDHVSTPYERHPKSVSAQEKMGVAEKHEMLTRKVAGDYLVNSVASYYDTYQKETVCNTVGTYVESEYVRTMLGVNVVVKDGDVRQRAIERHGRLAGFELVDQVDPEKFSIKAAKKAVSLLTAQRAPAGKYPIVFHPSITGLLTHEAIGHNAEADLVLSGQSIIDSKLGQRVASEAVTIVDDSTLPGYWGSYTYDSEGTRSQRRVIIDKGILTGYMHSLETAARMGLEPNGSARGQDYYFRPIVRMSNTFIEPGQMTFEEMIKDIDLGIYLTDGEWGYVMCESGQFTCHAGQAYMIRNGQLAEHLRDVSVCGMTLDTLMNIDAVSNSFEMEMPGTCGKNGQGMPVDNGGPHVRVKELVVGGQEAGR